MNIDSDFPKLEYNHLHNPYYEIEEKLVLIYYNLTRKESYDQISSLYRNILTYIKKTLSDDLQQIHYLKLAYKLIAQTRDIYYGKGERELTYALIYVLYDFYPVLAIYLIRTLVQPPNYGCWSDMKRLCHYIQQLNPQHSIIRICIELMNKTLFKDAQLLSFYEKNKDFTGHCYDLIFQSKKISNLAKWIPRENKKYGWLFEPLVINYYKNQLPRQNHPSYFLAIDRCKMIYRKMIAKINRLLNTTEIKLCEKRVDLIDPINMPLTAFIKHKNVLINALQPFLQENYYSNSSVMPIIPISQNKKGYPLSQLNISFFVKEAIRLNKQGSDHEIELLNILWKDYSKSFGIWPLDSYLPVLDMSQDVSYSAIGIACLIAERSTISKKILTFGNQPCWVNLDHCHDIFSMVKHILYETRAISNTNCDISPAIQLLQQSFQNSDTPISTIENMKLVVLSNNSKQSIINPALFTHRPIIVYWNLSCQFLESLPAPHNEPGIHIFSGSVFLPLFLTSKEKTSFQVVEEILSSNTRYDIFDNYIDRLVATST